MEFEFKGTKGEWHADSFSGVWLNSDWKICDCDCERRIDSELEREANALLISKAPEMLEFIKNYYRYLNIDDQEKAEQLLKSATELT